MAASPPDPIPRPRKPGEAALAVLAVLAIVAVPVPPASAQSLPARGSEPSLVQVGDVTVLAWPAQRAIATELGEMADRPASYPGLGRRSAGRLRLVLAPDEAAMQRMANGRAPSWGAGLAFPGRRTIVLRADLGGLERTLRHELAHLVLHEAVEVRLPLWFDEGYAAAAAGEWDRMDVMRLSWTVLRGRIPDFRQLDGALRGNASTADQAYSLAMDAVLELGRLNPEGTLDSLMARLGRREDFGSAVLASTGLTLGQFEIAWRKSARQRYNIFIWFVAGGFWTGLALALGFLAWYRRRRDRPRRLALDVGWTIPEEEPTRPDGPPSGFGDTG